MNKKMLLTMAVIGLAMVFISTPAMAVCGYCSEGIWPDPPCGTCIRDPGSTYCWRSQEYPTECNTTCFDAPGPYCGGAGLSASLSHDWTIASIEITHPDGTRDVQTAEAVAVASLQQNVVPIASP